MDSRGYVMALEEAEARLKAVTERLTERLTREREAARQDLAGVRALSVDRLQEIHRLLALLREVAQSVELEDARIGYVTVQVDADTWAALKREGRDG